MALLGGQAPERRPCANQRARGRELGLDLGVVEGEVLVSEDAAPAPVRAQVGAGQWLRTLTVAENGTVGWLTVLGHLGSELAPERDVLLDAAHC